MKAGGGGVVRQDPTFRLRIEDAEEVKTVM